MNKHDFIEPGTRVTVSYRPGLFGTVLSNTDPRAWVGSAAFFGRTVDEITPEEISAHLDKCNALYEKVSGKRNPYAEQRPRQPIAWDFGKVYHESVADMITI